MLIEFCGIPASGKSSLVGALLAERSLNGWSLTKEIPPGSPDVRMPRYVVRHPNRRLLYQAARFRAAHHEFFGELDRHSGENALFSFLHLLTAQRYQDWIDAGPENQALLFDEGLVGRSAALASTRGVDVMPLAQLAPLPDILVMVNTPPEVAFDRATRRHGDPDKMRKAVIALHGDEAMFVRRHAAFAKACEIVEDRGTPVLRIDTAAPLEDALAEVQSGLTRLLPTQ